MLKKVNRLIKALTETGDLLIQFLDTYRKVLARVLLLYWVLTTLLNR